MDQHWRERRLYPFLGLLSVLTLIYFNFNVTIKFPIVLWQNRMSFVGVNGTRFVELRENNNGVVEEEDFYINGWNSYWLMQESQWGGAGRGRVQEMMRKGVEMGLCVCRTWAFSDGGEPGSLQVSPGVFNEQAFQGLDYVIVEARRYKIRLILSLVNNLHAYGGKAQYVKWAQEAGYNASTADDSFFTHPVIKEYYKAYVKAILTRKNSYSGVKYSNEPAIFAWELINEPRCKSSSSAPALEAWIEEMSAYVKGLDPKHLVTVGLEGFYSSETSEKRKVNPGEWAEVGTDFIRDSALANIDFASAHVYPHSWLQPEDLEAKPDYLTQWVSDWVDAHISDGENVLKKPVLFTEVGSPPGMTKQGVRDREVVFRTVYDKIYESAKSGEAGSGALVWQLMVEGLEDYSDRFSFIARKHSITYNLIVDQSQRLRNLTSPTQRS